MPEYQFKAVMQEYLRKGCGDKRLNTRQRDASCAERLLRHLGTYWLTYERRTTRKLVLNGDAVRTFRELMKKTENLSPSTVMRHLAVASAACSWAIAELDYDMPNPFKGRTISRSDRKTLRPAGQEIAPAQVAALLLAASSTLERDVIRFALNTGFRRSEIRLLTWDRIDGNIVQFKPQDQKSGLHGARALNAVAREIIDRQPRTCEYVFSIDGRAVKDIEIGTWWRRIKRRSGVHRRFHDLRHTFAMAARRAGAALEDIQAQLGHSDIATTQRVYARATFHSAARAASVVSEVFSAE